MTRVFICYSRKDIEYVNQLVADLQSMGIDTWRDVDNIAVDVASNTAGWRRAVSDGLRAADAMIVVLSPDAVASQEVEAEWNYHLARHKPLFPVLYRDTEFPYRLMSLQIWDLRTDYRATLQKLVATIHSGVKQGGRLAGETSLPSRARRRSPLRTIALIGLLLIVGVVVVMSGMLGFDLIGGGGDEPTPTDPAPSATSAPPPTQAPADTSIPDTPIPDPPTDVPADTPTPTEAVQVPTHEVAIAFTQGDLESAEIALIDDRGRNLRVLTSNSFYDGEPDVSPGDGRIAYESLEFGNYDIYVMDSAGGNRVRLTNFLANERHPDWSPDGSQIAYEVGIEAQADLYVMRSDGTGQAQLARTPWGDRAPQFSPDGSQIAYMTSQSGAWQIAVINFPVAGEPRRFECPAADCRFPVWSPDGTQIAYNTLNDDGTPAEVYRLDVASGESTLIVPGNDYGRPTWAGDGLSIFFNFTREGNTDIYRYDVLTGLIERTTVTVANEYGPDWGLLPIAEGD